ncbi:MAG: caspase domain-containing protein [Thermoanaerobaculia bacterium]
MPIRFGRARALILLSVLLACTGGARPLAATSVPGKRRALLIGIDDYSLARSDKSPRNFLDLHGAVRDVALMREMLVRRYGISAEDVVTLTNRKATRKAIEQAIERHLIAPAQKDDVLLFYYAGHGSRVENSLSTELDHQDETIVPADGRDIRDKQLAAFFNRILDRGASLTIIADSCHSGSVSRALVVDGSSRAVDRDTRDVRDAFDPPHPESRGALVLTAAKDFARAFEITDEEGKAHGAFSWSLLKAMRAAELGEAAVDTFQRAQAMMRAEPPFQDPVIAGDASARMSPLLLYAPRGPAAAADAIALERIEEDGTVLLQGGWVHGLTVGSELRATDEKSGSARVRVTALLGVGRCKTRLVSGQRSSLVPGTLFRIHRWSAPPARRLRVWIPRAGDLDSLRHFTRSLRDEASQAGVRWIDDPTRTTPTHVLRWRSGAWELVTSGRTERVARSESARALAQKLGPDAALFVWLPVPLSVVDAIGVGAGTVYDSIDVGETPDNADYVLVGRLSENAIEYAWVRPGVLKEDEAVGVLPARTDWLALEPIRDSAITLRQMVLRLHKIVAWQRLESPADSPSPYALIVRSADDGSVVRGSVTGEETYRLALRALKPAGVPIPSRYYYIFGIDSFGTSVLLLPRNGSVENNFPIERDGEPPAREIPVGSVKIKPPYGLDTYVLVSTDESLPQPWLLEWRGVRTRGPRGETSLQELLACTGAASRASESLDTSPIWSVDRLVILSVPPGE